MEELCTLRSSIGRIIGLALSVFTLFPLTHARETRDYAIELSAEVQRVPAQIVLSWRAANDSPGFTVCRKSKDSTAWTHLASLSGAAREFTDANVRVGEGYEYRVLQEPLPTYGGSGFIFAGIDLPLVETRGKVILVVDATFTASLQSELERLEQDLAGDGWQVIRHDVSRDAKPGEVKALIKADYDRDPANVKSVFLFGHVPVPYSGNIVPDGHDEHRGAWPADGYYGDMDGNWSDSSVNHNNSARPQNKNVPGDGKFDQSNFPSTVELQVGRVDLANLPGFAPKTELDLLRQYLNKDHNFRHGKLNVARRALINDNFGEMYGEAFASSGYRNFSTFFGSEEITSIPGWQYFDKLSREGYLWSYACGGGSYNYCHYVGGTGEYNSTDVQTVFTFLLGSYFGDWDADNNFLRAPLGSPTFGLTAAWAGRPHWFVHHMALGETIGYGTRLTQNGGGVYHPRQYESSVHVALMGDPTLRMHPVAPPSNVVAVRNNHGTQLRWAASSDSAVQSYNIYGASSSTGPFTRINTSPVDSSSFIDSSSGASVYMVKAVKLEESASGTYFNASQGVIANVSTDEDEGIRIPLTITRGLLGKPSITFPSELGQKYVVEVSTNLKTWSQTTTVIASSILSSVVAEETGPATFYRVRRL